MPSEFASNIREIGAEIRLLEKATATAVRRNVRAAVAVAAEETVQAIRQEAFAQGLDKAAAATAMRTSFAVRTGGATIRTSQRKAPYARALELGSKQSGSKDMNRHPVFAAKGSARYEDSKVWVDQPTRPFFRPAVKGQEPMTEETFLLAVDLACRQAGWRT